MDKIWCLGLIVSSAIGTLLYGLYHVKIRKKPLRRTANLDIALLVQEPEKRKTLEQALNGFIMIESAFASVTAGILFIFVSLFATGSIRLEWIDIQIARLSAVSLGIATVSWILSLEQLSHLVSPSLSDRVFCNLYKEAFNYWNLGLTLLLFSVTCVLLLVDSFVSLAVAGMTTLLSIRSLYLAHDWGDNGPNVGTNLHPPKSMAEEFWMTAQAPRASLTLPLAVLFLVLSPLYGPLNQPRLPLHNLETSFDAWVPFWPLFVVPYISYFALLILSACISWRTDRRGLDRLLLAGSITLAVAYLFYGFFQTIVPRPLIDASSWSTQLVQFVYHSDNPYNAFPSIHSALSVLCALAMWPNRKLRYIWGIWAALILASTLLIKQHFAADMIAGIMLAVGVWSLAVRAIRFEPEPVSAQGAGTLVEPALPAASGSEKEVQHSSVAS